MQIYSLASLGEYHISSYAIAYALLFTAWDVLDITSHALNALQQTHRQIKQALCTILSEYQKVPANVHLVVEKTVFPASASLEPTRDQCSLGASYPPGCQLPRGVNP
ncbi:hypothetical protein I7I50_11009 [Histoplasma capsulatum G186AR]|uniref:Uncharacterized protein n=1 Tax=Ajellomyces capsulatus TaxID=5037 RepID=A0A8H7Z4K3_AJECA|nr:hypothetical protein I7I52_02248 [Histoplasma capsulatum]QSS69642.1 hypothetical protein I7I50_11009 [Histoplasma capsulatum G186AR]